MEYQKVKMSLKFLHLNLHGLIRSKNLELGRDSDTGGQTRYVLELVKSLANTSEVDQVDLVTRLIEDTKINKDYSKDIQGISPKNLRNLTIKYFSKPYLSISGKENICDEIYKKWNRMF